ncbi:MAG: hypothetical protein ACOH2K_13040 [Burkholderiaceae bacterium]
MKLTKLALACALTGSLAACGGGGSGTAITPPDVPGATTLSGTAAIGQPIAGSVFAIDINGKMSPAATTTALGAFVLDVGGMTAPYILSITGSAGGQQVTLNSIATAAGQTVNITPLTDLIVSTAAGRPAGSSLVNLCAPVANVVAPDCLSALKTAATPAKLDAAVAAVSAIIAPLNTAGTNPLKGAFTANGTGMDAVLDQILVSPADAQGDMATVTLIATNISLGKVKLNGVGETATITPTPPLPADLIKATAAANVLPEIRACLASLSALYPTTGFVAPSQAAVTPYVDSSFNMGASSASDQNAFIAAMTSTSDMAVPGLTFEAVGLSPFDMSPLSSGEISTLTSTTSTSNTRVADFVNNRVASGAAAIAFTSGIPSSAWFKLHVIGDAGVHNWKMVKTTDTTGCAGGWKIAGSGHLDMHMNARIRRNLNSAGTTFVREWAFHIQKGNVDAENLSITKIDVRGPGLTTYGGFATPGTAGVKLQLIMPATGYTAMRVADSTGAVSSFYDNAEAIQSCQDLASISPSPTGLGVNTPCIDETKVAPGKVYVWTMKNKSGPVSAFPFQINAVPLSKAFANANQSSLFATITSVTPSVLSAMPAGSMLDGQVTFNYTQSATYGSKMDNCGLYLWNTSTQVLNAEQNAVGKETSCTFTTLGLNSLASNVPDTLNPNQSLFKFTGPLTNGYIGVTTSVLGNQASSGQPYPN